MKTENKAIEPLADRLPKPLYLVAQHTHGNLETAFAALNDLITAYPSIRFGLFRNGGKWLVFRVHEQEQRAYREAQSDGGVRP